jgi:hypothetical protein
MYLKLKARIATKRTITKNIIMPAVIPITDPNGKAIYKKKSLNIYSSLS